jgi:hypothetical protein
VQVRGLIARTAVGPFDCFVRGSSAGLGRRGRAGSGPHGATLGAVSLGPLTNLARRVQADPARVGRLDKVTLMGSNFSVGGNHSPEAEFNFACYAEESIWTSWRSRHVAAVPYDTTGHSSRRTIGI